MLEKEFQTALDNLQLVRIGKLYAGFQNKSLGAKVRDKTGKVLWLKVSIRNRLSDGFASEFTELAFTPHVFKFIEGQFTTVLLMELQDSRSISYLPWLSPTNNQEDIVHELLNALQDIRSVKTTKLSLQDRQITTTISKRFGDIELPELTYASAHCDMNWSNIGEPFVLFDTEGAGLAPLGIDEAFIYITSLLQAETSKMLEEKSSSILNSPQGKLMQLYACAELENRYWRMEEFKPLSSLIKQKGARLQGELRRQ